MTSRTQDADFLRAVGSRLQEARTRAGLTQTEAAEKLGWSRPQTIGNWELGEGGNFSIQALRQLCELYQVSCDWVLGTSQTPSIAGAGGIIDLAVERAIVKCVSMRDLDKAAKGLRALQGDRIIIGYPIPAEFEIVSEKEWRARRNALLLKVERLSGGKLKADGPANRSD